MGLFFPRKISATCAARRPSTAPSALITCHLRWSKLTFGKNVFMTNKLKKGESSKVQPQVNRYFLDFFACQQVYFWEMWSIHPPFVAVQHRPDLGQEVGGLELLDGVVPAAIPIL